MSNLLHELTDEEVKTSLSNGGTSCSVLANEINHCWLGCQMSHYFGGDSQCNEMQILQSWYDADCR